MGSGFFKKGCLYQTAFAFVVAVLIWLFIIGFSASWPLILALSLMPLGSLILSLYKQRIGGLLIILSGLLFIIILANIPSLKSDDFYSIGMIVLFIAVTLPLCIAGIIISFAPLREPLEPLNKGRKYIFEGEGIKGKAGWFCDKCDTEVAEVDKICPKCAVEFEEE